MKDDISNLKINEEAFNKKSRYKLCIGVLAAALAVGLAIQGGLTNLVGGILILVFKPFKVGDWIETSTASVKTR